MPYFFYFVCVFYSKFDFMNLLVFLVLFPFLADQFVCHTAAIADIVILVDGSWSIGRINFKLVRTFLENLVNAFDIGIDKTRIGGSQMLFFLEI